MNPSTQSTYTPMSGLTPQGQQQYQLNNVLAQIQSMPSQAANVSPQQVSQAQANALNFQSQIPQQLQQAQQSLTQQAGVPQLQQQSQNLSQIFPLWLADQNLSQKYSSPQLSTPNSPIFSNPSLQSPQQGIYTGTGPTMTNPYLADPQTLINAVTQPSGQGFQGFTNPGFNTYAIGQVPAAATSEMGLLQNLISGEQGLVGSKMGDISANYQSASNMLSTIANLLAQEQASRTGGGGSIDTLNSGAIFNQIIDQVQSQRGGRATETDIWNYINQHDSALRLQGVNVDALWALEKDLAGKVGAGNLISGGTKAASASATKLQQKTVAGKVYNYDPNTGKYYDISTGKQTVPEQGGLFSGVGNWVASLFQPPAQASGNEPKLKDFQGNTWFYSSTNDPDYVLDKKKGWQVIQ